MDNSTTRRHFLATAAVTAGGLLLVNREVQSQPPGLRIRKEIRSLPGDDLTKLRNAFNELQRTTGLFGYQKLAGYHGEPDNYCHRDEAIFLPWHRAYILRFEQALQKIDASVNLPFWEWTSDDSIQHGIPQAISAPTYQTPAGMAAPNPLFKARIDLLNRDTFRNPRPSIILQSLASQVSSSFTETAFENFNDQINIPHGGLHTWVRGDMFSISYAAYDPIFWLHHANVDRQWAQWQLGPNNADPLSDLMTRNLDPFGLTVGDVVDYKNKLGYDYDMITPQPSQPLLLARKGNLHQVENFRFNEARETVQLYAHDLMAAPESYNVDVFINEPDANEKTPLENNPHYAGSFGIFGGSQHVGRHADMHAMGRKKTLRVLNITRTVGRFARSNEKTDLQLKFVVTDKDGKPVDLGKLPLKGFSLQRE